MPDVTALPQPGDTFAGKYLIERAIGGGKASLVFSARHCVTGKRFAIEYLLPSPDQSRHDAVIEDESRKSEEYGDASDLIRDESTPRLPQRVIGHFRHPNVLEVYDVGEDSGSLYTVMEWNEGESLAARLGRLGPLSIQDAARLLVPAMRGMHEAHMAGIVHGDLKPANVYIFQGTQSTPEVVKVLDFEVDDAGSGVVDIETILHNGGVRDTKPFYRSPEELGGLSIDHRADVYAFGAILYEVLSGRPPYAPVRQFNPDDLTPTRAAALQARTERLPAGADIIVGRAMARDVAMRIQTLHELADALEVFAGPIQPQRGYGLTRTQNGMIRRSLRSSGSNLPKQSVSRNRPWPRPPSVPDDPEYTPTPTPEPLATEADSHASAIERQSSNAVATLPTQIVGGQQAEPAAPSHELPEWSDTSSTYENSLWNDKTEPNLTRDPSYAQLTPFFTELPLPQRALIAARAAASRASERGGAMYVAAGIAVITLALVFVARFTSDDDVITSFDAASSQIAVVDLEKQSADDEPSASKPLVPEPVGPRGSALAAPDPVGLPPSAAAAPEPMAVQPSAVAVPEPVGVRPGDVAASPAALDRANVDLRVLAPRDPEAPLGAAATPAAGGGDNAAPAAGQAAPVYRFGWKPGQATRNGVAASPAPPKAPLAAKKPAQASNVKPLRKQQSQQQLDKISPSTTTMRGMKPAAAPAPAPTAPSAVGLGNTPKPRARATGDSVADRPMQLM